MNAELDSIRITTDPISLDAITREIGHSVHDAPGQDKEAGALVTFSGIVRETEDDRAIPHLDYEHYEGMANKEIAALIGRAREQWPIRRAAVWHRVGTVAVAEPSVIVAVSTGHRAEAFEAARFLIDELKRSVPIWKAPPSE